MDPLTNTADIKLQVRSLSGPIRVDPKLLLDVILISQLENPIVYRMNNNLVAKCCFKQWNKIFRMLSFTFL